MEQVQSPYKQLRRIADFLITIKGLREDLYNKEVQQFIEHYRQRPEDVQALQENCSRVVNQVNITASLTDAGIISSLGFFPELRHRIKARILPPLETEGSFSHFIRGAFTHRGDYHVLAKLSEANWEALLEMILGGATNWKVLTPQVENALVILTHRLVGIGIDPYLVSKLPAADDNDSPFFQLNLAITEMIHENKSVDPQEILRLIHRCRGIFEYFREQKDKLGISLHLTYLMQRANQHLNRIELLYNIYSTKDDPARYQMIRQLLTQLLYGELNRYSIWRYVNENTSLLAYRVASQTSQKGGHYIGFSIKENKSLLWSSMGGGFVVVFLVYIKHFIHALHLSLLPEGILFGLNYGLGFILMHLVHFSLATKQPAMTASYIAENIERRGLGEESRKELSLILAQIMRSQVISLVGNLIVVLPMCFLSAWGLLKLFDYNVFSTEETTAQLVSNHPLLSGSLLFAVFTGVFLTLAGLITGYYDNKVVFSGIQQRIVHHPLLKRGIKKERLEKIASFIAHNLGAIMGNLILGLCLGLAGNLGKFTGIPFDIRHITISGGNFGIAIAQGYGYNAWFIGTVFLGVLAIGGINILSSFLFSFLVACRSRYLSSRQTWIILRSLTWYIIKNPGILLFGRIRK